MGKVISDKKNCRKSRIPFPNATADLLRKAMRPERTLNDNCTRQEMKGNQKSFSPKNKDCTEVYEMKRDRIATQKRENKFRTNSPFPAS